MDLSLRYNLLIEPIVLVATADGETRASLPELYALLWSDRVLDFPRLRPHQLWAWHMFLVQLAYHATDGRPVPDNAEGWRASLRALTAGWPDDEPWHLVGPIDAPAFLQPPVPEGDIGFFRQESQTPDELDILIAARNHDVKLRRMIAAEPNDWLFALVSIQTMGGFEGRGLYGVMRMNGGYGSRPFMGVRPAGVGPGAHLRRDLQVLRRHREALLADADVYEPSGHRLLSLLPWDGQESLAPADLHPLAIEICRRLRLVWRHGAMRCLYKPSSIRRIDAETRKGVTGDPWAPVLTGQDTRVLTLSVEGFGWRRTRDLLFGDTGRGEIWKRPVLGVVQPEDGAPVEIVMAGLARGQGRTNGYHERFLSVPTRAVAAALGDDGLARARAANLAMSLAEDAGMAANRCLKTALLFFLQKCPERIAFENAASLAAIEPWMRAFDARVDLAFFPALWRAIEADDDDVAPAEAWRQWLRETLLQVFRDALSGAASASSRHVLLSVRSREMLHGLLDLNLPVTEPRSAGGKRSGGAGADLVMDLLFQGLSQGALSDAEVRRLQRLDPASPDPIALAPLMRLFEHVETSNEPLVWRRVAAVARVTATAWNIHNPAVSLGGALQAIGFSESRLAELVEADFDSLTGLAHHIARRLAASNYPADLRQLASLVWRAGWDEDRANVDRRRLVAGYYLARHKDKLKSSGTVTLPA